MSDVTDALDALGRGDKTLGEVIIDFQARTWPKIRTTTPGQVNVADDPEPMVEGSFDEVASYFDRGKITAPQYAALAHAVAGAEQDTAAPDDTAEPAAAPA